MSRQVTIAGLSGWLAIALGGPAAFAQMTTGAILGTVSDSTGAVIPQARVTVQSAASGQVRSFSTDGAGSYAFPELKPGPYSLTV
jgi:uncharacterized surface anchored protein